MQTTCTITFKSGSPSIWGIAIVIEDFLTKDSMTPLSKIPVQFLIEVKPLPDGCTDSKPSLIPPSPAQGSAIIVFAEVLYTAEVYGSPVNSSTP